MDRVMAKFRLEKILKTAEVVLVEFSQKDGFSGVGIMPDICRLTMSVQPKDALALEEHLGAEFELELRPVAAKKDEVVGDWKPEIGLDGIRRWPKIPRNTTPIGPEGIKADEVEYLVDKAIKVGFLKPKARGWDIRNFKIDQFRTDERAFRAFCKALEAYEAAMPKAEEPDGGVFPVEQSETGDGKG